MTGTRLVGGALVPAWRKMSPRRIGLAVLAEVRLSDEAYRSRHGVLRIILWLQVPLLAIVARLTGSNVDGQRAEGRSDAVRDDPSCRECRPAASRTRHPGHGRTPLDARTESISTCFICRASA
jgi:hypothetical protein